MTKLEKKAVQAVASTCWSDDSPRKTYRMGWIDGYRVGLDDLFIMFDGQGKKDIAKMIAEYMHEFIIKEYNL